LAILFLHHNALYLYGVHYYSFVWINLIIYLPSCFNPFNHWIQYLQQKVCTFSIIHEIHYICLYIYIVKTYNWCIIIIHITATQNAILDHNICYVKSHINIQKNSRLSIITKKKKIKLNCFYWISELYNIFNNLINRHNIMSNNITIK